MLELRGKEVLVTGAARGMGRLEAINFARAGLGIPRLSDFANTLLGGTRSMNEWRRDPGSKARKSEQVLSRPALLLL